MFWEDNYFATHISLKSTALETFSLDCSLWNRKGKMLRPFISGVYIEH